MNIFDRSLKIIARNYPQDLMKVVFPSANLTLLGTADNVEISLPTQPVDFVHEVAYNQQNYTLHLEFQLEHKPYIPQRTFITAAHLTAQYKRPTLTAIIYLRPSDKDIPSHYETTIDALSLIHI